MLEGDTSTTESEETKMSMESSVVLEGRSVWKEQNQMGL